MMKNSKVKEIVIPALSLFLICLIATALLAFANEITQPKIQQLAKQTQAKAKQSVLGAAKEFSDEKTAKLGNDTYAYFEGYDGDETVGYVFSTSAKGYGGDIDIMVGIDAEGTVTGVSILEISETAGLGMNAKNEWFLNRFVGKNSTVKVIKNGTPADNEISALTGATITSNAMAKAVNIALDLFETVGGENNG